MTLLLAILFPFGCLACWWFGKREGRREADIRWQQKGFWRCQQDVYERLRRSTLTEKRRIYLIVSGNDDPGPGWDYWEQDQAARLRQTRGDL